MALGKATKKVNSRRVKARKTGRRSNPDTRAQSRSLTMPEVQVEPEWFPPEGRPGKASCGLSLLEKPGQVTRSVGLSPTNNGQTTYNRTL